MQAKSSPFQLCHVRARSIIIRSVLDILIDSRQKHARDTNGEWIISIPGGTSEEYFNVGDIMIILSLLIMVSRIGIKAQQTLQQKIATADKWDPSKVKLIDYYAHATECWLQVKVSPL